MEMGKFRKKPVVIEAIQFLGKESAAEIVAEWIEKDAESPFFFGKGNAEVPMCFKIWTLEGEMTALIGDWIIKGVKGEFYPCKNDLFEATYESV